MMYGLGGGGGRGRPMKCMACDLWSSSYDHWLTHLVSDTHQYKVADREGNIYGHQFWTEEEADCCLKVTEVKAIPLQALITYLAKFGPVLDVVRNQDNATGDFIHVKYDSPDATNKIMTSQKKAPHQVQGRQIFFHRKCENSNQTSGSDAQPSAIGLLVSEYWDAEDEAETALGSLSTIYKDADQENPPESEKMVKNKEQHNGLDSKNEKDDPIQKKMQHLLAVLSDKSLDDQLEEFCNYVSLPESAVEERMTVVQNLLNILKVRYPKCKVHQFGTDYFGIGNSEDPINAYVDLFDNVQSTEKQAWETHPLQQISQVYQTLKTEEDNQRFCSDLAKTDDEITFTHLETKVQVSMRLSGEYYPLSQEAKFIKFLCSIDPRVKPLLVLARYWVSVHKILQVPETEDPARLVMLLMIFHLASRNVIPTLAKLQNEQHDKIVYEGMELSFSTDKSKFPAPNQLLLEDKSIRTFSTMSLFQDFFQRFGMANLKDNAVSLWFGKFIQKKNLALQNQHLLPEEYSKKLKQGADEQLPRNGLNVGDQENYFCIQDFFDMNLNLGLSLNSEQVKNFQSEAWRTGEKLEHIINSGKPFLMDTFMECAIDEEIQKQKEQEKQKEFQEMHKQVQEQQQKLLQMKKQKEEEERKRREKKEEEERQQRNIKEAEERRRRLQREEQEERERRNRMREEEDRKRQKQRDEEEEQRRRRVWEDEERQRRMQIREADVRYRNFPSRDGDPRNDRQHRFQTDREVERNRLISNQEDEQRRFIQRQQEENRLTKQREFERQEVERKKYEEEQAKLEALRQKELDEQQWKRQNQNPNQFSREYDDRSPFNGRNDSGCNNKQFASNREESSMNRNYHQADDDANHSRPGQLRRERDAQPSGNYQQKRSSSKDQQNEEDDWLNTEWEEFSKSLEAPATAPPASFLHLIQKKPVAPIAPSQKRRQDDGSYLLPPPPPAGPPPKYSRNNMQYGHPESGVIAAKAPLRYDDKGISLGLGGKEESSRRRSSEFMETDSSEESSSSDSDNDDEEEEGEEVDDALPIENTRISNPYGVPKITMCPFVKNLFVEAVESKDFAYGIRGKLQTLFLQFMKEFNNRFWKKCFGFEVELDPTYQDTSPADYAKFGERKSVKMTELLNSLPCYEDNFISAFYCQSVGKLSRLLTNSHSNDLRNGKFIRKQSTPLLKVLMDEVPGDFVSTAQTLRFKVEVSIVLDYEDLNKDCRPYIKLVFEKGLAPQNEMLTVFQFFGKLYKKMAMKFLSYCYKRWLASCVDFDLKATERRCTEIKRASGKTLTRKERRRNRRLKRAEKKKREKLAKAQESSWAPSYSLPPSRPNPFQRPPSEEAYGKDVEVYNTTAEEPFYRRNQPLPQAQIHRPPVQTQHLQPLIPPRPPPVQIQQQRSQPQQLYQQNPAQNQQKYAEYEPQYQQHPPQNLYPPQDINGRGGHKNFVPGRGKTFPVPPSWGRSIGMNNAPTSGNNAMFRRQC